MSAATPAAEMAPWRVAEASGQWLPQFSVLLDNRNLDGKPGYWLATPLLDGGTRQALLVLRGWIPRVMQGQPEVPSTPPGEQAVRGELSRACRACSSCGRWAAMRSPACRRRWRRAASRRRCRTWNWTPMRGPPGSLLPTVLSQFGDGRHDDGLVHDWPQPSVDFQKNTFYAVQWFSFALFAAVAWLVVMAGAPRVSASASRPAGAEPPRGHGKPAATTS